jgi:hypothetical protein
MTHWAKWQLKDRAVNPKILDEPQLRFGPYNILAVTDRSMNYLYNIHFQFQFVRKN